MGLDDRPERDRRAAVVAGVVGKSAIEASQATVVPAQNP
jgi:hypothetical protein